MKKLNGQYKLIKYSSPGWWKVFNNNEDLVASLRSHICSDCLSGQNYYIDENGEFSESEFDEPVIDIEYNGILYECKDIGTLLGTPCGCEFGVEIDGRPYHEYRL